MKRVFPQYTGRLREARFFEYRIGLYFTIANAVPIFLNLLKFFTIFGYIAMFQTNISVLVDGMLQNIRATLGREAYDVVMSKIIGDYFGETIEIREAIMYKPELFETAFLELLGQMGFVLLAKSLAETCPESIGMQYSKRGDFARYITVLRAYS